MVVRQGDVFWVDLGEPRGSEPGYRHPYVVIQNDVFNTSKIATTLAVALTSNISRASIPGNVLLRKGEANLPKASVANLTQLETLNKTECVEKIGRLSPERVLEILQGLRLITEPKSVE